MRPLKHNIPLLYAQRFLCWSFIHIPVFVLYLQSHQITLQQVLLIKSFLCVVTLVLEIPSGYYADLFGRKRSMVLGQAALSVAMLIYAFGTDLGVFLVAEFFIGIGWSFISGADSALLYDTLSLDKDEIHYPKYESRMMAISAAAEAVGGLAAGYIAAHHLSYPFFLQGAFYLLALLVVFFVKEPERPIVIDHTQRFAEFKRALKFVLVDHPDLRWLLLYNAVLGCATFAIVWLSQPYMEMVGVPIKFFGVIWAVLHIWLAVTSVFSTPLYLYLGSRFTFTALALLPPIAYILMGLWPDIWSVSLLLIFYFVRGVRAPIARSEINRRVGSDIRATVISTSHFATSLLFAALSPILGWFADAYSLMLAFLISAGIFLALGIFSLYELKRVKFI